MKTDRLTLKPTSWQTAGLLVTNGARNPGATKQQVPEMFGVAWRNVRAEREEANE
jgi:hypothetical protein